MVTEVHAAAFAKSNLPLNEVKLLAIKQKKMNQNIRLFKGSRKRDLENGEP